MNGTLVSIIICTRNRADSLRETLASIGRCVVPADLPTEVIVVDNGSTDHTKAVVEQASLVNLPVRYILEPTPGQCHARNTGLAVGCGHVYLFTDDDVRVPTNWIDGMCREIINGNAHAVAGSVVFPQRHEILLANEPYRSLRAWFACTRGIDSLAPERMVGANMAFARLTIEAGIGFDTELGPGALGFYDETLFSWQLKEAGYRLVSRFNVTIEHHFDTSRLSRSNLLSIAKRMGASEGYIGWHWHHAETLPSRSIRWRALMGLWVRRLARPWKILSGSAATWELRRVQVLAYYDQLSVESRFPRKYNRATKQQVITT